MRRYGVVRGTVVIVILLLTLDGCTSVARQRAEIANWEAEAAELGHPEVKFKQTKDPDTALALSFLPFGIAGFYVHRPGLGVTGILFWPLSIFWTAPLAPNSARNYDYEQFRRQLVLLREESRQNTARLSAAEVSERLADLERLWKEGKISDSEYQESRRKLLNQMAQ